MPWSFKLTMVFNDGESFNYSSPFCNPFQLKFDNLFIQWGVLLWGEPPHFLNVFQQFNFGVAQG